MGAAQSGLLVAGYLIVLAAVFVSVVARYFFTPIYGMDELTGASAIWLYAIGGGYAAFKRVHIKAEVIQLIVKDDRLLNRIEILASGTGVVICSFLAKWAHMLVTTSMRTQEILPATGYPAVWFQSGIFVGAILMAAYFLAQAVDLTISEKSNGLERRG
jgi:TRAP-type C4-dicarboxylate transport system permease small subunit